MKPALFYIITLCAFLKMHAQVERTVPPIENISMERINDGRLIGKVLDNKTRKGLEAASVQLFKFFEAEGKIRDSLVAGQFTRSNGDFSFDNLPQADSFRIVISGIGYRTWQKVVVAAKGDHEPFILDLGNIFIEQEARVMTNVVITSQRPALQMGIDRKIFSVERSLVSTGGTALDIMRNIPTVKVDVEGNVQLRNAQPLIFVDGRPTILTLEQIPADQVDRIELITNPSAKFDASSTAGIINVVMKRNRRMGLNGVVSAGGGHPSIWNGNLSLNARQGKFNFFVSGGYNQTGGRTRGKTFRQNKIDGRIDSYFDQYSLTENSRRFGSIRGGIDFFISNRSTLSASQNFVKGKFRNDEEQDQEYRNSNNIKERYGYRTAEGSNQFNRYNSQLDFTHRFPRQGQEFTASANYSYGNGKEGTSLLNSFYLPDGSPYSDPAHVKNEGRNNNDQYTFQVDYTNPVEDRKFEAGLRTYKNKQENFFSSFSLRNGSSVQLPLSNNYAFNETVHAAYFSFSNKIKRFSYQGGLRTEISKFQGELIDSSKSFGYRYPKNTENIFDALFPSLFLSLQAGERAELQVNYTRRIRRPNFWHLNPFIDINDPVNLRQGNPQLKPEFTNSFEFNYSQEYEKGDFLGVVYYRNNKGNITRYSDTISAALYQQLNNAAIDPNAILNTFINARSINRLGAELTLQHSFSERFEIIPVIDMQYRKVNATVGSLELSNKGFNWDAELTMNYKIITGKKNFFRDLSFQLTGEYESREVTAQGRNLPEYLMDFAIRKDFLKEKKASITFNLSDVFNTQRFGNIYDTENFYQESYRRRNVRSFRINFTYKFGKEDFSLTRKQAERGEQGDEEQQ